VRFYRYAEENGRSTLAGRAPVPSSTGTAGPSLERSRPPRHRHRERSTRDPAPGQLERTLNDPTFSDAVARHSTRRYRLPHRQRFGALWL
jgi:hypothetical protein